MYTHLSSSPLSNALAELFRTRPPLARIHRAHKDRPSKGRHVIRSKAPHPLLRYSRKASDEMHGSTRHAPIHSPHPLSGQSPPSASPFPVKRLHRNCTPPHDGTTSSNPSPAPPKTYPPYPLPPSSTRSWHPVCPPSNSPHAIPHLASTARRATRMASDGWRGTCRGAIM